VVRIEVVCAKEDIAVDDIQVKSGGGMKSLPLTFNHDNRRAAAEAYIRTKLFELGLEAADFDDPYGRISIADVIARSVNR
jgi:hypothetical protein